MSDEWRHDHGEWDGAHPWRRLIATWTRIRGRQQLEKIRAGGQSRITWTAHPGTAVKYLPQSSDSASRLAVASLPLHGLRTPLRVRSIKHQRERRRANPKGSLRPLASNSFFSQVFRLGRGIRRPCSVVIFQLPSGWRWKMSMPGSRVTTSDAVASFGCTLRVQTSLTTARSPRQVSP